MKRSKETKKKPYRSPGSNILWSFRGQIKYAPGAVAMCAVQTPVKAFLTFAAIYIPSLVVTLVTEGGSFSHAAAVVGGILLAVLLADVGERLLRCQIVGKQNLYRHAMTLELNRKSLGCFYQVYERKALRELRDRAITATETWDGVQPLTDLPREAWTLVESVLCYALFGAVISFVSPWLLVLLTFAPGINWFCVRAYQNWSYRTRDRRTALDSRMEYLRKKSGDFAAAKDIRVYGMTGWLREMFRELDGKRRAEGSAMVWRHFLSRSADLLVILLRDGITYALLISMALRGEISPGQFVLYFAAVSSFAEWVGNILGSLNKIHSLSLTICDLREYLEYPEPPQEGTHKASEVSLPPEIVFDHVSFRYDGAEEDTLKDISFTLSPGEKVALVGLNGAGKTTLVKLLCGLYLPTQGDIRVGGYSLRTFSREEYYKLFSPVFQDIRTAFYSLAQTVSCKSEQETDYALAESCMRQAGLGAKLDSLPLGVKTCLDKQVNKESTELSGGEKQKLMLARALYKNAPVLVLDEPTSALDPIAENEIYRQYNEMSAQKTSLFISHRLASTRFCDRILYLEKGRILQEGSHESLLAAPGPYAQLYEMQSCWYREEKEDPAQ